MGMIGSRMRMVEIPDWMALKKALELRTGLYWTIFDNALPSTRLWIQYAFKVARFGWEVDLARRVDGNVVEVEMMPLHWPAVNYPYWQVIAALHVMGGLPISGNGQPRSIRFPRWISRKWDEMPWWCRYPG